MSRLTPSTQTTPHKPTWHELLARGGPLVLPAAHDALSARLIARAGFRAYQIGGFALAGARWAYPDIDLIHFQEIAEAVQQVAAASPLPVLVDAGDGFGDVKNVTRTVQGFEASGASAVFIEDQVAPVSCGQEGTKRVVPVEQMQGKIRAAVAARANPNTFILARTDARGTEGVPGAILRGELYRDAGADGVYVEGLRSERELRRVGKALDGTPLATTMMEGGGRMPWLPPERIHDCGFAMILYPTTVLLRMARALERAVADLKAGRPMPRRDSVTREQFEEAVGMPGWADVEKRFGKR